MSKMTAFIPRVPKRYGAALASAGFLGLMVPIGSAQAVGNPTIIVNDLGDGSTCDNTTCTLRGAVGKANADAGADTIAFGIDGSIALATTLAITGDTTISGTGHTVALTGTVNVSMFDIAANQTVTIDSLSISGVSAVGGDGASVSGGAIGSSGGGTSASVVFNRGVLTLSDNTITGTTATGGNGGNASSGAIAGNGGTAMAFIVDNAGRSTLTNNTITGTTATGGNGGNASSGGIAGNGGTATAFIVNNIGATTLTNNTVTGTASANGSDGGSGSGGIAGSGASGTPGAVLDVADSTAPAAAATASPAPNGAGWNNSPVTITWNWADTGSGLDAANCAATIAVSSDIAGAVSTTCADWKGNSATASLPVQLDTTPPSVSVTGVSDGASYPSNAVPTPGCNSTDAASGIATAATLTTTGTTSVTITCAGAVDIADNAQAAPVTASYTVTAPASSTTSTVTPTTGAPTTGAPTTTMAPMTDAGQPFIVPPPPAVNTVAPSTTSPGAPTTSASATASATPTSTPAAGGPTVVVNSSANAVVTTNDKITVEGSGFQAGSTVTVEFHSDPITLGTAVVRADGTFTFTGTVPAGAIGQHQIVVLGTSVGGTSTSSSSPITVSPAAATVNDLALTGQSSRLQLAVSFLLISFGAVILVGSKRRPAAK